MPRLTWPEVTTHRDSIAENTPGRAALSKFHGFGRKLFISRVTGVRRRGVVPRGGGRLAKLHRPANDRVSPGHVSPRTLVPPPSPAVTEMDGCGEGRAELAD